MEEGSANLPILKVKWDLIGDLPDLNTADVHKVEFENKNNAGRIGWNEIVVERVSGINIFNSTAFGSGITDELKSYPGENLNARLDERKAEFSFTSSAIAADVKPLQNRDGHISTPVEKDKFAELINGEITPSVILFGLILAFGFGAMHALSPGHGKTVVGAYLVGSRGTVKHAIFLGAIVTITHTLGVFALGLLTLFASKYILPETLMPFLSFVSGLLVLFIGLALFKDRLFIFLGWKTDSHNGHAHDEYTHNHDQDVHLQDHNHAHDGLTHSHGGSTHTHLPPRTNHLEQSSGIGNFRRLASLSVSSRVDAGGNCQRSNILWNHLDPNFQFRSCGDIDGSRFGVSVHRKIFRQSQVEQQPNYQSLTRFQRVCYRLRWRGYLL